MIPAPHLQRRILRKHVARLADPAITDEHVSREDQRLRSRAALRQTLRHQQLVGAQLSGHFLPASRHARHEARWTLPPRCPAAPGERPSAGPRVPSGTGGSRSGNGPSRCRRAGRSTSARNED